MSAHDRYLQRALTLANHNISHGGRPFGAVLVRHDEVIAEAVNTFHLSGDPTAHAEISAIRSACATLGHFHLTGCTLYTSSEPCPMCLSAAYWARIERIVFANSRAEAAAIGFCDDELYEELNRHFSARSIVMEHHPLPEALQPMQDWFNKADHTRY